MKPFEYASPKTEKQAVGLLGKSWSEAEVLAGGTDLLALMKDDVVAPKRLVNVKHIENLGEVHFDGKEMRIGALVTMGEAADNALIKQHFPILHEALWEAASPQIRNMATMGGNLCQRPRCWYFRNGMGLLPVDEKGESLVLKGDNRYHAVLGNHGPSYFVSPSTIAPVLIAYGARIRLYGPEGARQLELEKFYRAPMHEGEREHALKPNEMITDIFLPAASTRAGYAEIRQKEAFDWPMASCAAVLEMNGSTVKSARIVLGQVAPVPWFSPEAALHLTGKAVTEETAMAAAHAALENARNLGKNKYKITVAKVAVKRAILNAAKEGA